MDGEEREEGERRRVSAREERTFMCGAQALEWRDVSPDSIHSNVATLREQLARSACTELSSTASPFFVTSKGVEKEPTPPVFNRSLN